MSETITNFEAAIVLFATACAFYGAYTFGCWLAKQLVKFIDLIMKY